MREAAEPTEDIAKTPFLHALGLSRATFYRWLCSVNQSGDAGSSGALTVGSAGVRSRRISGRALTTEERQVVADLLYSAEFVDKTPTEIYAALLDSGVYHCSSRTMYRLLKLDGPCPPRTRNRTHQQYAKPELIATCPNQLWSWDITRLKGPAACHWYQLYVILDVFSRYVVAWMVAEQENQALAAQFIDQALASQNVQPSSLTVHADRGAALPRPEGRGNARS